jgi:hypothetical protein
MKRMNGRDILFERDSIGEFHCINPKLVKAHCDYFWAKRGMSDPGGNFREQTHNEFESRKSRRKGGKR